MVEELADALLSVYTREFLVRGHVKIKRMKIGDQHIFPRRISDIISSATERMSKVGEPDFLELTNVDLKDLKTNQVLEGLRSVVVSKSAITIIIPGDVAQMDDES